MKSGGALAAKTIVIDRQHKDASDDGGAESDDTQRKTLHGSLRKWRFKVPDMKQETFALESFTSWFIR